MRLTTTTFSLLSIALLVNPNLSWAASVAQVKDSKILINLEGTAASSGDEIYLVNESGKKVGLAKIKAIKGEKALAELVKGKAAPGMSVQAKAAAAANPSNPAASEPAAAQATSEQPAEHAAEDNSAHSNKKESVSENKKSTTSTSSSTSKKKKNIGGFLLGYAMNTMTLTAQYSSRRSDLSMKDSGFIVKGFYDYSLMKELVIRIGTGIQMFNVKDTASQAVCDGGNSTACEVSFTYLVGEANANYYLTDGSFKLWAGLGYSFLIAAAKKNNIPNLSSDSSTNQMITAGLGADWWTSRSAFIPISIHYGMFPGSSNVTANAIFVQGGYGFFF